MNKKIFFIFLILSFLIVSLPFQVYCDDEPELIVYEDFENWNDNSWLYEGLIQPKDWVVYEGDYAGNWYYTDFVGDFITPPLFTEEMNYSSLNTTFQFNFYNTSTASLEDAYILKTNWKNASLTRATSLYVYYNQTNYYFGFKTLTAPSIKTYINDSVLFDYNTWYKIDYYFDDYIFYVEVDDNLIIQTNATTEISDPSFNYYVRSQSYGCIGSFVIGHVEIIAIDNIYLYSGLGGISSNDDGYFIWALWFVIFLSVFAFAIYLKENGSMKT